MSPVSPEPHPTQSSGPPPPRPLQVYHRRLPTALPPPSGTQIDPHPLPNAPIPPVLPPELDLPITFWKGICSSRNLSPHYVNVSYHRLSPVHYACVSSLSSISIPKTVGDALSHPGWRQALLDEMCALQSNGTWDLTPLPLGKTVVVCSWIFNVKVGLDG